MKATRAEVEIILVNLILDGDVVGSIDQVKGFLHLSSAYVLCAWVCLQGIWFLIVCGALFILGYRSKATTRMYAGVAEWATALQRVSSATQGRLNRSGNVEDMYSDY